MIFAQPKYSSDELRSHWWTRTNAAVGYQRSKSKPHSLGESKPGTVFVVWDTGCRLSLSLMSHCQLTIFYWIFIASDILYARWVILDEVIVWRALGTVMNLSWSFMMIMTIKSTCNSCVSPSLHLMPPISLEAVIQILYVFTTCPWPRCSKAHRKEMVTWSSETIKWDSWGDKKRMFSSFSWRFVLGLCLKLGLPLEHWAETFQLKQLFLNVFVHFGPLDVLIFDF